jgi:hypothetical protein
MGWEYWVKDGDKKKPIRVLDYKDVPMEVRAAKEKEDQASFFWAMMVHNYTDDKVQLLEIRQSTIRKYIEGFNNDESWGDPRNYDITITKEGDGFDTEYRVVPAPPAKFEKEVPNYDVMLWVDGGSPFDVGTMTTKDVDDLIEGTNLEDLVK